MFTHVIPREKGVSKNQCDYYLLVPDVTFKHLMTWAQARCQGGGQGGHLTPPPKWPNSTRSQDNPPVIIKGPKIWPIWPPPQKSLATGLWAYNGMPTTDSRIEPLCSTPTSISKMYTVNIMKSHVLNQHTCSRVVGLHTTTKRTYYFQVTMSLHTKSLLYIYIILLRITV